MARSKKKTVPQKLVGVATTGMPKPVKGIVGSRLVALLIVIAIPMLLVTGVVSVKWEGGRPKLSFDRERASEIKEEVGERVEDLRDEHDHEEGLLGGIEARLGVEHEMRSQFSASPQPDESFGTRVAEHIDELKDDLTPEHKQGWGLGSGFGAQEQPSEPVAKPFSRLRERIEGIR